MACSDALKLEIKIAKLAAAYTRARDPGEKLRLMANIALLSQERQPLANIEKT